LKKIKQKNPTLTIKGFLVVCAGQATGSTEQGFDWENALIDAAIISAVTFFSALGGGAVAGLGGHPSLECATVAALTQFFIFLALKRGIVQSKEP
jgi:hypothetical protein